jgi:7-cyano-7-deazaguanine synthase
MCALVGAVFRGNVLRGMIRTALQRSKQRGRDSSGGALLADSRGCARRSAAGVSFEDFPLTIEPDEKATLIANLRAEPTHEFLATKTEDDIQPYVVGKWLIVHNGTIANDKELTAQYGFQRKTSVDSEVIAHVLNHFNPLFHEQSVGEVLFENLRGSFAVLVARYDHPGDLIAVTNYKPLYFRYESSGVVIASQRAYLDRVSDYEPHLLHDFNAAIHEIRPYSAYSFFIGPRVSAVSMRQHLAVGKRRALAVCSGGLDSSVAAAALRAKGDEVTLMHYLYGSRADRRECDAVASISAAIGARYLVTPLDLGLRPSDSPLLNTDASLAVGSAGAEFAHEWVPARNLIMLAHATAFAEANGYDVICLGNNLEESNSHPDNEMEFINRFNALLPFSVGVDKHVVVEMPVGHLMKREIIQLGVSLNLPLQHTYSCYEGRTNHCGKCASCYLRRSAFRIADVEDPTTYDA